MHCSDAAEIVRQKELVFPFTESGEVRDLPRPKPRHFIMSDNANHDSTLFFDQGVPFSSLREVCRGSAHACTGLGACLAPKQHLFLCDRDDSDEPGESDD